MRFPQHREVNQRAARTAQACATNAQRAVANRHVLANICRAVKRQRQAQRLQHSDAIMENHVPAREKLQQPAQRLSVGRQRHAARDFGVWRIERIIVDEEGESVALHTPVGKNACHVDYHEPAREAKRKFAVADHSVCGRLDHNRDCGFSRYDHARRSSKIGARKHKLRYKAREGTRRSGRGQRVRRNRKRVERK